jgi:hypothetical protein
LSWGNALNWSNDAVPVAADDVTIDVPGTSPTIMLAGPARVARSVRSLEPVQLNGASLTVDRVEAPSLSLTAGALLTTFAATTTAMHKLGVEVSGALLVDATSRIDVSGKGYYPGRAVGNAPPSPQTVQSGGSYGGRGGGSSAPVYGDYADPDEWGGGGGTNEPSQSSGAGHGGGLVQVASATFQLDGHLLADGGGGFLNAGAGGGISVDVGRLQGTGTIRAAGGNENN